MAIELKKGGRPTNRPDPATLAELYSRNTAREIALRYGVAESTVRSWIARARQDDPGHRERSPSGA